MMEVVHNAVDKTKEVSRNVAVGSGLIYIGSELLSLEGLAGLAGGVCGGAVVVYITAKALQGAMTEKKAAA